MFQLYVVVQHQPFCYMDLLFQHCTEVLCGHVEFWGDNKLVWSVVLKFLLFISIFE